MILLDPFLQRALLGGIILSLASAPLGCFVVWKRMAYFGDALAHSALLGIALGLWLKIPLHLGTIAVGLVFAFMLYILQRRKNLGQDTVLGIMAHAMLAYGLLCIALMPHARLDLHNMLFGDILSIQIMDIYGIIGGTVIVLSVLGYNWQKLLLSTLNEDLAKAEGQKTDRLQALFLICLTLAVALAIQVTGIVLVTSMLIIPAATARVWARSPESMAVGAILLGWFAVASGLYISLLIDIPTGPCIVAFLATLFFIITVAGVLKKP